MAELAKIGETLEVNGEVLVDENGRKFVEVPTNGEAQDTVLALRRRVQDLPDVPERMNALSVVLSYELFGLTQYDIANATGLTPQQVGHIQMLDAYVEYKAAVVQSIQDREADTVVGLFRQGAKDAAAKVVEHIGSPFPSVSLAASKEVLDRSGNTVKQVVEHQHKVDGGLRIEYIKRDNSQPVPTIDVKPVKEN